MDEDIIKSLLKKATGYTFDEIVEEYSVKEDGGVELTKKKITTKHYPPDGSALKTYLELTGGNDVSKFSDEELEKEKTRLLKLLKNSKKT